MKPDLDQQYPGIAEFVLNYGWIELGRDEGLLGLLRALDEGGLIWESGDKRYSSLDEAFADLEQALSDWMDENL